MDRGATWRRISAATDPEMQDITALAFDPADTNVLYAGTPHLPWKTTDGGATWHSISTGLIDDSDIFSIRVDPNHPQLVFASACSGIYRSDSGGEAGTRSRAFRAPIAARTSFRKTRAIPIRFSPAPLWGSLNPRMAARLGGI